VLEVKRVYERTPFAREWLKSAREQQARGDVFSAYFSAYVALAVCCAQIRGDRNEKVTVDDRHDETLEKEAIEAAFKYKCREISDFLDSDHGKRLTAAIWQREILENKDARIIGAGTSQQLKEAALTLSKFFNPSRFGSLSPSEQGQQAQELTVVFRKVRNRLFHGGKINDPNGTDADLLVKLNPLLIEIVEILQQH
jgi:hypothetical protein